MAQKQEKNFVYFLCDYDYCHYYFFSTCAIPAFLPFMLHALYSVSVRVFWAIFVTMAAEQFGTNLRATVATTVPNMVRGSLNLVSLLFGYLQVYFDYLKSGWITGIVVIIIGLISVKLSKETFGKDLNYVETI